MGGGVCVRSQSERMGSKKNKKGNLSTTPRWTHCKGSVKTLEKRTNLGRDEEKGNAGVKAKKKISRGCMKKRREKTKLPMGEEHFVKATR